MEGAETFIEQYGWGDDPLDFDFTPELPMYFLKRGLEDTIQAGCKTIAVWRIKPKPSPILITGEEINGETILITEKL